MTIDPTRKPLTRIEGYVPIEDYGLVGDGATAALIGRDGAFAWLCLPRFDSPPVFCSLLDDARGGHFTIAPEQLAASRQFYEPDTALLVTEMHASGGLVRVTDSCPLAAGADLSAGIPATRRELLRSVAVVEGTVRLRIHIDPRGGAEAEPQDGGVRIRCLARPDLHLHLSSTVPLTGLHSRVTLKAGQSLHLLLCWRTSHTQIGRAHV